MRVLLIEDEPTTAKSIELMLGTEGFNVYTTDLGEEGLGKMGIVEGRPTGDRDIIGFEQLLEDQACRGRGGDHHARPLAEEAPARAPMRWPG